jgi:peptide chain release factor 2
MENMVSVLQDMKLRITGLIERLDLEGKSTQAAELEVAAAAPDLWNDPESAQKLMQTISRLKNEVERWNSISNRINDALELVQLDDPELNTELEHEVQSLTDVVHRIETQALLSKPYDNENAILAIHAGAGGTESQDWAQMLERMYLRWAEQNGFATESVDRSNGEEAGIKSAMYSIKGEYAYGFLQSEQGVHRLVRLSPFDAAHRRHTSFAKVELWPDIQGEIDIQINEKDLKIETYRAGGAGGQNVQKNDTAVRITYLPLTLVVQCQNERSQKQNRERAMHILKSRLFEIERKKQEDQLAVLKGDNVEAGWGNQIRSYVLHPYQLVKDHRTNYETGNTTAVLDGKLDDFMDSFLHSRVQ